MSKHTPGPWRWIRARTLQHLHGPKGYLGVSMPLRDRHDIARLIAAAPELLEFAQWIERRSIDGSAESIKAREVIAKATGPGQ